MSIKTLMTLICSINFALVVVAVFLVFSLNGQVDNYALVSDQRYHSYLLADELRQSSDDLTRLGRTYAITSDEDYEKMYFDILDIRNGKKPRPEGYHKIYWDLMLDYGNKPKADGETAPLLDLMKAYGFSDEEFALLKEAQANSNALVNLEVRAMNAVKGRYQNGSSGNYNVVKAPDLELARNLLHGKQYHIEKAKIMQPIDEFFTVLESRTHSVNASSLDSVHGYVTAMSVLLVLILICVTCNYYVIKIRVSDRIRKTSRKLTKIGENSDLTLTMPIDHNDEVGNIAQNINVVISKFRQTITNITDMSDAVQANSQLIASTVETGKSMSERQKSETTQAAAAVEEMTMALSEVAKNTSEASEYTQKANEFAEQGKGIVSNTIEQIRTLSSEFEATSTVINELAEETNKVGGVLVVIKSIAEQTNLLALNAAIEAARAGEQGRGFAVVADEVRSLAQRTQESTAEIEEMVSSLQNKASKAIESIESGAKRLATTTTTVETADAALIHIVDSIASLENLTAMIASATEEQASVSGEISRNIVNIDQSSESVAEGFNELSSSAERMNTASSEMIESVRSFKV